MKMKIGIVIVVVLITLAGGYRLVSEMNKDDGSNKSVATPVGVELIKEELLESVLTYEGRISPDRTQKVSFKTTARLLSLGGEVGDTMMEGDLVAALDLSDLELAMEAAIKQRVAASANYDLANAGTRYEDIELAKLNVNKAMDGLVYLSDQYEKMQTLLVEGVVSQGDVDGIKLQYDLGVSDLALAEKSLEKAMNGARVEQIDAARAQVGLATTNEKVQASLIADATYHLDVPMVVIKQLYEVGELVPAGYPVVILRSESQSVTLGVARKDLEQVFVGQKVHVHVNNRTVDASVSRVAQIPDEDHFLYEVEVSLPMGDYVVGEVAGCELVIGQKEVVKIPVASIMNESIDYVYVVENQRAVIKQIEIIDVVGGYAMIQGLEVGDQMIVSNLNQIMENSLITIEE